MNAGTTYWTARGAVRGDCGHRHRTREAAERCAEQDRHSCASLGGGAYSDRQPIHLAPDGYEVGLAGAHDKEDIRSVAALRQLAGWLEQLPEDHGIPAAINSSLSDTQLEAYTVAFTQSGDAERALILLMGRYA